MSNQRGRTAAVADTAEATEVVAEEAPPQKQWVRYRAQYDFQERIITERDWRTLGAEGDDVHDVKWSNRNHFRVPRDVIPLTDDQLAAYLAMDNGLELYEGN